MRKVPSLLIALATALAIAACGGASHTTSSKEASVPAAPSSTTSNGAAGSSPATGAATTVSAGTISGLGPVLVDAHRRTLYTFAPDQKRRVTCTGVCAQVWPPAFLSAESTLHAAGQVKQSLLGSDPDPAGGRVITYAGWPLYTFVSDSAPGQAGGQALRLNGGLWYVIAPSGTVIHAKP